MQAALESRLVSRWILSVDLGQTIDPTAIAVLEVTTRQDAVMAQYDDPPGPAPPMDWFRTNTDGGVRQPNTPARIDVRYLERIPLRTPYPDRSRAWPSCWRVRRSPGEPP